MTTKTAEAIELVERQVALTPPEQATTSMQMLAIVAARGGTVEEISKWMDLAERQDKNEARKAFVSAMNAFKANPPTITKNKQVSFGTGDRATTYSHATLDHVC